MSSENNKLEEKITRRSLMYYTIDYIINDYTDEDGTELML